MPSAARLRSLFRPAILAGALLLLVAVPLHAQTVPKLSGHVTDQTGSLGGRGAEVEQALADLLSRDNVELWVVFVPTTDGDTAQQFAQRTFETNGLGGNDTVLVVAVNDHRYGWWETSATGLSTDELNNLLSQTLEPRFRANDYPGGIVDFVNALENRISPAPGPTVKPPAETPQGGSTPGGGPPPQGDGGGTTSDNSFDPGLFVLLIGLVLVVCGVAVVALRLRAWRLAHLTAEERDRRTGQLARDANRLLVESDDAIRDAQQELGFAEAEFDEADVAPFRDAIASAQKELAAAFTLRQQLDDEIPEDPPTRERMYGEIVSHCQAAGSVIAEQHKRLQTLRDLEKTAPAALAAMPAAIAAIQARLPAIQAALATLAGFAPSSWAPVRGNPEEADKRGAFAESELERGKAALASSPPDTRTAAHSARAAQEAIAQANQLLDAVERQAAALEDAQRRVDGELQAARADLDAAKAAAGAAGAAGGGAGPATAAGPATVAGAAAGVAAPAVGQGSAAADLARAETVLQNASALAAAAPPDPIAALKAAQDAHAAADRVLGGIRAAEQQRVRAMAAFAAARQSAAVGVQQAQTFIASRRSGVGREARTRLAEAERHLGQADAIAATDIAAATLEARTADQLADQAYDLARNDFDDFDFRGRGGTAGGGRGGGGSAGDFLGGLILGGILSGGGRRGGWGGGGFGGTPWGSGGGWGGGGGGGGGLGGFGGFGGGGHGGGGGWGGGGGGGGGHGGGGGW